MQPADFVSAIIFPQLRPWHLSLGRFGAGGRHVSRFGSMQERPGPRDGGEYRGKAQRHPKVTHPKTPSGPCGPGMELFGRDVPTADQVGKWTCTYHCHPGHISIQSPRHLPATSPTQGGLIITLQTLHGPHSQLPSSTQHQASPSPVPQPHCLREAPGTPRVTVAGHGERGQSMAAAEPQFPGLPGADL